MSPEKLIEFPFAVGDLVTIIVSSSGQIVRVGWIDYMPPAQSDVQGKFLFDVRAENAHIYRVWAGVDGWSEVLALKPIHSSFYEELLELCD